MNTDRPGSNGKGVIDYAAGLITTGLKKLPDEVRGHVVAVIGEFVGTALFLGFSFAGTQVANVSSNPNSGETVITTTTQKTPQQLLYISLSFGFALAVNAWVFFRISGGLFNPAVTIGMWMIGAINTVRAVLLFGTQLVGGIVAAAIVQALFTGDLNVSTSLSSTTTVAQGVIIEMILTLQLVFTIFMLAAEKHAGNFIAPVGIGLSLFIAELTGVFWTGGSLNPARSFGPAVVTSFDSQQWIYWVGPIAGTICAVMLFKLIKALEYTTVNGESTTDAELGPSPPGEQTIARRCTGECGMGAEKSSGEMPLNRKVSVADTFTSDGPRADTRDGQEWGEITSKASQRTLVDRQRTLEESPRQMRTVNEMV